MARVFSIDQERLSDDLIIEIADCIQHRTVFVYPTETFYAIGACYDDGPSLERIFNMKGRALSNPLPLLVPDIGFLPKITDRISDAAESLAERFWPGPLTLVFKARQDLNALVTAGTGKVGCRISGLASMNRVLKRVNISITTTSANLSGQKSAALIKEIDGSVLNAVDVIVDGGQTTGGLPSTVLDVSEEPFKILRNGAVSDEVLQAACPIDILTV